MKRRTNHDGTLRDHVDCPRCLGLPAVKYPVVGYCEICRGLGRVPADHPRLDRRPCPTCGEPLLVSSSSAVNECLHCGEPCYLDVTTDELEPLEWDDLTS